MEPNLQKRDLRAHFEAILGRDLAGIGDGEIGLSFRVGLWSQELENGHVTSQEIDISGNARVSCGVLTLSSVAGQSTTGEDGKADFLLSEFTCEMPNIVPQLPIIFVATPYSQKPVFVTVNHALVVRDDSPQDFRIQLYTWEAGGAPAKKISVDWFCQFPFFFNSGPIFSSEQG
jgi:hypothetical protein